MKSKITKKEIIELLIIIVFLICSLYICTHHEYWADEAHAWLFARDCTVKELLTKYLHSDGHPALWHLTIKLFQKFGLQYDDFCIISILFSSLGVAIFVIYSKFPMIIKALLPFTYFIFFQYTVIVRGYCLIFFLLCLLATIYDKRHEKPFLYTLIMGLLINTESYIYIFAGMLYITYIYEFIKEHKNYSKKQVTNNIISIIMIFTLFGLTALYVYPYKTNTFKPIANFNLFASGYAFSNSFFTVYNKDFELSHILINTLGTYLVIILIFLGYKKDLKKGIQILFLTLPVIIFLTYGYTNAWHVGIIFLLYIFLFWIHHKENNKFILVLLGISIISQLYWTISSSNYELKNSYSGAKVAADFIKQYDYENLKIFGIEFYASALNPYFEHNLYENWDDKGFFYWDSSNKFYNIEEKDFLLYIQNNKYDIVVVAPENKFPVYDNLNYNYNIYEFTGNTYIENHIYESQSYHILVRKTIDKR